MRYVLPKFHVIKTKVTIITKIFNDDNDQSEWNSASNHAQPIIFLHSATHTKMTKLFLH